MENLQRNLKPPGEMWHISQLSGFILLDNHQPKRGLKMLNVTVHHLHLPSWINKDMQTSSSVCGFESLNLILYTNNIFYSKL